MKKIELPIILTGPAYELVILLKHLETEKEFTRTIMNHYGKSIEVKFKTNHYNKNILQIQIKKTFQIEINKNELIDYLTQVREYIIEALDRKKQGFPGPDPDTFIFYINIFTDKVQIEWGNDSKKFKEEFNILLPEVV